MEGQIYQNVYDALMSSKVYKAEYRISFDKDVSLENCVLIAMWYSFEEKLQELVSKTMKGDINHKDLKHETACLIAHHVADDEYSRYKDISWTNDSAL